MSEETEQITILNKVKEVWDTSTMGSLQYPNLPTPAPPGKGLPRSNVLILHPQDGREPTDLGSPRTKFSIGLVNFTIHLPAESGTLVAKRIIDKLQLAFDELTLTTEDNDIIKFGVVSSQDLGQKGDTYRMSAVVRFRRQETA